MANHFGLSEESIPRRLYRVHYTSAQTTYDVINGFQAGYQTPQPPPGRAEFFDLVDSHLNWTQTTFRSRYISTFSDRTHAENWARRHRQNNPTMTIELMTIEPTGTEWVASVGHIMIEQGDWNRANNLADEYLFYRQIPFELITATDTF
ncbi:hypothetical protein AA313_de0203662 [Arthrobotrys entomopaga]|nr:hypothetical protein AA313_de0203662 [Arthrobotrys entomopaga]